MLGERKISFAPVPKTIKTDLRHYQVEGVNWLERLRKMYLSGILADDMGLGKTLQAIVAVTQLNKGTSLIVCPTSLLYNWKEEFAKFNPKLKTLVCRWHPHTAQKVNRSRCRLRCCHHLVQPAAKRCRAIPIVYFLSIHSR